ncbi:hypothetical protein [Pediococcus acidilactici]|uniref:hypothetical protein n=1 Tax=Pediococcus acidilactici TaxID=1254 RepID=UPI003CF7F9E9
MPDFSNKTAETLGTSGTANSAVNQEEYNNLDTNRYYKETAQLDFSTANFSNAQIEKTKSRPSTTCKRILTRRDKPYSI